MKFFGKKYIFHLLVLFLLVPVGMKAQVLDEALVDSTFSDFPVAMRMVTTTQEGVARHQYVAYYDVNHEMCVAHRSAPYNRASRSYNPFGDFSYTRLNSFIGYDSHNFTTICVDDEGYIHLCGNMHGRDMNYWRSREPYNIYTLEPASFTGREQRCTYPVFLRNRNNGEILFTYREGVSGSGDQYLYAYRNHQWRELPTIFEGSVNSDNVYVYGLVGDQLQPVYNPTTGYYELCFLWRETPDASTCKNLCYVRTRDFRTFENYRGRKVQLPITSQSRDCIIDEIPTHAGLVNTKWDVKPSPQGTLIAYHKYDEDGSSQIYAFLLRDNTLIGPVQLTSWEGRYEFGGGGSGPTISGWVSLLAGTGRADDAPLWVQCQASFGEAQRYYLDRNLQVVSTAPISYGNPYPRDIQKKEIPEASGVSCMIDLADPSYLLRYEHFSSNRDKKPDGTFPHSSLKVVHFVVSEK